MVQALNNTTETRLNFWIMKNMSTSEYESLCGISAWAEMDRVTDSTPAYDYDDDNDDDNSNDDK